MNLGRCLTTRIEADHQEFSALAPPPLLAGSLTIFSAGSHIFLHSPETTPNLSSIISSTSSSPLTALTLDQSPTSSNSNPSIRLAAFHRTGEFSIYGLEASHHSTSTYSHGVREIYRSTPPISPRTSNIICAAYHHPILITLSSEFHLSIYFLPDRETTGNDDRSPIRPLLRRTVQSYTSFAPSSLSLTRSSGAADPSPQVYKLLITYAVPVYPSHWSVGASELILTLTPHHHRHHRAHQTHSSLDVDVDIDIDIDITSSRNVSAIQAGWSPSSPSLSSSLYSSDDDLDPPILSPQSVQPQSQAHLKGISQWNRKVGNVAATQTDGKWVILAGDDNTLQVHHNFPLTSHRPDRSDLVLSLIRSTAYTDHHPHPPSH